MASMNESKTDINALIMGDRTYTCLMRRRMVAKMLIDGKPYSYIAEKLQCSSALIADVSKKLQDNGVIKK